MAALESNREDQPEGHVVLTTADGVVIPLLAIGDDNKPLSFAGSLTPVDATEQFRPGGIPREFRDFSAGAGYTFYDERVPNGYDWAKNVWTMGPSPLPAGALTEIALPAGTHGAVLTGIETGEDFYFSTGRYAIKLNEGTSSANIVCDFATQAGMSTAVQIVSSTTYLKNVYWGGYANATAQPMVQQIAATDTFTTAGATTARWHVAAFNGVDGEGTWAEWLIGTVASGAAFAYTNSSLPMTSTNWTPASADGVAVGNPLYAVNKIVAARQAPFFLKPEGVFIVQRFGVAIPNITPHWKDTLDTNNGVAGAIVSGRLYANILAGIDMVVGLDGQLNDEPTLVHPGVDLPTEMPAAGTTYAIIRDGNMIVAAVYNSARETTYICWGIPRSRVPGQPGLTTHIWHVSPCVIEGERVTWMYKAAPAGNPRLWIATRNVADTTTHVYWMSLPRNGNVLQELAAGGPWRCRTDTCTLYMSRYPGLQGAHSEKAMRQVATVSKDASSTSYLEIYVDPDESGRVQLGNDVTESPYVESRILTDISGRQMAPSVDFTAGSSTTPPILRALTLWTGEGVKATTTYQGRFRMAKGMKLRHGSHEIEGDPQAQFELLKGAQGPRPATMVDWKGSIYTIALEQGAVWDEREVDEGDRFEIDFTMRFTVIGQTATYQSGFVYDSEAVYAEDS